jgi:histidyl-tRNA synthetase
VVALLIDLLRSFGLTNQDFVIRLSNREAWYDFLDEHGVEKGRAGEFLNIVDKMEREPAEKTEEKLVPFGIPLTALQSFVQRAEIPSLAPLLSDLEARGLRDFVRPDLGVVRGLAYYTGVVFEAFALQGNLRAIAGGGRYDRLLADLSDGSADLPAIGFGVGDAVLLELINEVAAAKAQEESALKANAPVQIYIVIAAEEKRPAALALSQKLRAEGWRVAFPLGSERVGKQFGAAESAGATLAVVIGAEWPVVKVKRLADRHEEELAERDLLAWLQENRNLKAEG